MSYLFLTLAVLGGTVLICQFVLTLIGIGGGHDVPGDLAHDGSGAGIHDSHAGIDQSGEHGHDTHDSHATNWLFSMISFRTLVAASTFFGLGGMASLESGFSLPSQLGIASLCGFGAMYGVHSLMKWIGRLGVDGTVRIQRALGQEGTVYIPIPAGKERAGKVQLRVQSRLMEYPAVTDGADRLATGTKVRVVGIAGGDTLEVLPVGKSA